MTTLNKEKKKKIVNCSLISTYSLISVTENDGPLGNCARASCTVIYVLQNFIWGS